MDSLKLFVGNKPYNLSKWIVLFVCWCINYDYKEHELNKNRLIKNGMMHYLSQHKITRKNLM